MILDHCVVYCNWGLITVDSAKYILCPDIFYLFNPHVSVRLFLDVFDCNEYFQQLERYALYEREHKQLLVLQSVYIKLLKFPFAVINRHNLSKCAELGRILQIYARSSGGVTAAHEARSVRGLVGLAWVGIPTIHGIVMTCFVNCYQHKCMLINSSTVTICDL